MPTLAKLAKALGVEPAELMAQPPVYVLKWPRSVAAWDRQVPSAAQALARQTAR